MRLTDEQQLEELKQERETLQSELDRRRANLNAGIWRVHSRISAGERETDTRRKILIGAMVLNQADLNPEGSVVA